MLGRIKKLKLFVSWWLTVMMQHKNNICCALICFVPWLYNNDFNLHNHIEILTRFLTYQHAMSDHFVAMRQQQLTSDDPQ